MFPTALPPHMHSISRKPHHNRIQDRHARLKPHFSIAKLIPIIQIDEPHLDTRYYNRIERRTGRPQPKQDERRDERRDWMPAALVHPEAADESKRCLAHEVDAHAEPEVVAGAVLVCGEWAWGMRRAYRP
jgi:hypothetical protein